MCNPWLAILEREIAAKGRGQVARELGVSPSTLSLVLSGKYPASTEKIENRVAEIYGEDGLVNCPMLGEIEPARCADNWQRAQKIKAAGNPATIRLYRACRSCLKRG
ncbi:helix-turn-helix domain-containing protein [Desulfofustis limnaeus]|jgi:hypothetical protein|uniref:Transcriptional regulator n=1 Tax=Desulfofustis limnaeus TaxID=2740163 RepID=A0ABM7W4Y4_9BACT|nr:helix-turn-helix transcriptional regulator [Desulfofustis limnaeus]BDD85964.1 hypothetical protein DPPLL_03290 [Desulfofustis limnaeus]